MEKVCLHKDINQITVTVESGKIKWLPTLIQETKDKYKKEGFSLVEEENRKITHYPGYRYRVILTFIKKEI